MKSFAAILILLLPTVVAWGQIKDVKYPPGLVELKPADIPDGATYRWKPVYPFDLKFREYLTLDAKLRVCLLDLDEPGKYVVDLLVINWESKQSFDVRHIIEIEDDAPLPPGPEPKPPGPGPEPKPPAPAPDDLSEFALIVRNAAIASKVDVTKLAELASPLEVVASQVAAGGIKNVADAFAEATRLTKEVSARWPEADRVATVELGSVIRKRVQTVRTIQQLEQVFLDASAGLASLRSKQ